MNEFAPLRASASAASDFAWTAQMVRPTADAGVGHPASFLRKEFDLAAPSGGEVLRISALGRRAPRLMTTVAGLADEVTVAPLFAGLAERVR